ncbi:MAG TPA: hypothetical protein VMM12_01440 [Longimicrobiales bacterium]|nr:hypothetical protein [Longimicrobiales bacterium]
MARGDGAGADLGEYTGHARSCNGIGIGGGGRPGCSTGRGRRTSTGGGSGWSAMSDAWISFRSGTGSIHAA